MKTIQTARDQKLSGHRRSTQLSRGKCKSSQHFAHHHHLGGERQDILTKFSRDLLACFWEIRKNLCSSPPPPPRGETDPLRNWVHQILRYRTYFLTTLVTSLSGFGKPGQTELLNCQFVKPVESACIELPAHLPLQFIFQTSNNHLPVHYIPSLQGTDRKLPVNTLQIFYTRETYCETECNKFSETLFPDSTDNLTWGSDP